MWKNQGSWNFFHTKLIPNSSINSVVLQYLLALIGMILIWLGYRLIKGLFDSKQTLEELEEKIKQQYKDSVGN